MSASQGYHELPITSFQILETLMQVIFINGLVGDRIMQSVLSLQSLFMNLIITIWKH